MNLIVAMIAQRYRPDLVPGFPVAMEPGITLRAKHGMLMTLEKPDSPAAGGRPPAAEAPPAGSACPHA